MSTYYKNFEDRFNYNFDTCPEGTFQARLDCTGWGKRSNLILYFTNLVTDEKHCLSVFANYDYAPRDRSYHFKDNAAPGDLFTFTTKKNSKERIELMSAEKLDRLSTKIESALKEDIKNFPKKEQESLEAFLGECDWSKLEYYLRTFPIPFEHIITEKNEVYPLQGIAIDEELWGDEDCAKCEHDYKEEHCQCGFNLMLLSDYSLAVFKFKEEEATPSNGLKEDRILRTPLRCKLKTAFKKMNEYYPHEKFCDIINNFEPGYLKNMIYDKNFYRKLK